MGGCFIWFIGSRVEEVKLVESGKSVEAVKSAKAAESGKSVELVYRILCIVYRWFSV